MDSPFVKMFQAMQERIVQQLPGLGHVAHDTGQLSGKGRPPVSWPCVLIDFEDFTFTNMGEHVQMAKGTVVLKLGFAPYSPTAQGTPAEYKDAAMAYYRMEAALHIALQGWSPGEEQFGSLYRVSVTTQRRTDGYRVRELRYSVSLEDYSTKPQQQWVPAEMFIVMG